MKETVSRRRAQSVGGVLIWIVRLETKHKVSVGIHHDGVPSHRHFWERRIARVGAGCLLRSGDGLKGVAVEVEWMFAFIIVVEDDLNDFTFLEDEGVRVGAIDLAVGGQRTGRHDRVKCRNLRANIRDVVEEGTITMVRGHTELDISGLTSLHRHPGCPS